MSYIDNYATIGPGTTAGGGALNLAGGGGVSGLFANNPGLFGALGAGAVVGGALLGTQALPWQGQMSGVAGQIGGEAQGLYQTGQTLISPEITGQLPSGAQAEVQTFINNQTAAIKSKYAQLGLTGSTMETDELNNIQTQGAALTFNIAQSMAQQGIQLTGQSIQGLNLEAGIYENLMKAQLQQNQQLFSAIGSFAGALGKFL